MINLINGSLSDPQENIQWADNKSTATIILNTHLWKEGETLIIGYLTKENEKDIIVGLGVKEGVGPSCYRVISDKSTVLVSEVILDHIPDVSYYVFDQRYLVRKGDGNLYFIRRYLDHTSGDVKLENLPIKERCLVVDTVTNNVWICDPPGGIINFFELTIIPVIGNITEGMGGEVKIDITSERKTWKDLYFIKESEKSYLTNEMLKSNFEMSLSGQKYDESGNPTSSRDPLIVRKTIYTLSSKYKNSPIDLDYSPDGWTRVGIGEYTKTIQGGETTGSGEVTGEITILGNTVSKTIEGITEEIDKYIYISYSTEVPTTWEIKYLSSTSNLGLVKITPPQGQYTWFAFPQSMRPIWITQLGVTYTSPDTVSGMDGEYTIYRSLNQGNGESQEVNIL